MSDKTFLIGLFAYLVQSERSLHRSLNADWCEFLNAYRNRYYISPQIVIKEIEDRYSTDVAKFKNVDIQIKDYVSSNRLMKLILRLLYWILRGPYNLSVNEISLILKALNNFDSIITLNAEPKNQKKIEVRNELYFASLIIKDKLPSFCSINKKIERVEHFYQSEYNQYYSINQIIGCKWIE